MVDITPKEIKWMIISIAFLLAVTSLGVGAVDQQPPSLDTSEINTDFFPTQTPETPEFGDGGIESETAEIIRTNTSDTVGHGFIIGGVFEYDVFINEQYESTTYIQLQFEEEEVLVQEFGSEDPNENVGDYEFINQQSYTVDTIDQTVDVTYTDRNSVQYDFTFQKVDENSTSFELNNFPIEESQYADESEDDSGLISAIINSISFLADVFIFGFQVVIFAINFIFGIIVGGASAILTVFVYIFDLVSYLLSGLNFVRTIHPILSGVMSIPLLIFSITLGKIIIIMVRSLPTT